MILLGCVKRKRDHPATAKDLYSSPLWAGRRAYAESSGVPWLILSAKHGLVDPSARLAPYDLALGDLSAADRRAWGERVVLALAQRLGSLDGMVFEMHAGVDYRDAMSPAMIERGAMLKVPLVGLPLGSQLSWYRGLAPAATERPTRQQVATNAEVEQALIALDSDPSRAAASNWPARLENLDQPGLYSWWVDEPGAGLLSTGLDLPVGAGRIYAGQTGATKWPSGKTGHATLKSRIGGNHLRGQIRGSTFRLTLASILADPLELITIEPKRLDVHSEQRLSAWMRNHLWVAVHPCPNRDVLADLEDRVLALLDPPLNLERMPITPVRIALSALRSQRTA